MGVVLYGPSLALETGNPESTITPTGLIPLSFCHSDWSQRDNIDLHHRRHLHSLHLDCESACGGLAVTDF